MKYNPYIHQRQSIRLKNYDYSNPGGYFITVCTKGRECLFGTLKNKKVELHEAGYMVIKWWQELENKFGNFRLDEYIMMPNHIHGIITIVGADLRVCPGSGDDIDMHKQNHGRNRTVPGSG